MCADNTDGRLRIIGGNSASTRGRHAPMASKVKIQNRAKL